MTPEEKDAFMESVRMISAAGSKIVEKLNADLAAVCEALQIVAEEIIETIVKTFGETITPLVDTVVAELAKERSREASRRRPEPRAAKTRPPFRKRLKIFRCRSCC